MKYVILCKTQRQLGKTEFDKRRELCWLCPFPVAKLIIGMSAPCPMKVSLVSSLRPLSPDHLSDATVSPRTSDSSLAPVADFDYPPEFSSCLDNSAAKHKLLVKPRNQRSSKMRRLSSVIWLLPTHRGRVGRLGSPHPIHSTSFPFRVTCPLQESPMVSGTVLQELELLIFFNIN